MVEVCRTNASQEHHKRSTQRVVWNALGSEVSSIKDNKPGLFYNGELNIVANATAPGGARFLVVAIDYFTKWVEAKPLISITGKHMKKFVWEHIVCRFGRPQAIILDNGKQFIEGTFVEVTNREIIKGMERRLGKTHQAWINELPQVLWAHRTTPKSSNRETPFSLVYGLEAVIPIEISMETKRVQDFDPKENEKRRREDLDILEEMREMTSIREAHYKQKLEGYYNKNVKPSTFKPGTYVL
ncbi:reverse transcriptase domain-containing protein [Tanacetum coccineum]